MDIVLFYVIYFGGKIKGCYSSIFRNKYFWMEFEVEDL